MRLTVATYTCDACGLEERTAGPPPTGWYDERHVCGSCIGNLLDPADDIAGEIHRFELERRLA